MCTHVHWKNTVPKCKHNGWRTGSISCTRMGSNMEKSMLKKNSFNVLPFTLLLNTGFTGLYDPPKAMHTNTHRRSFGCKNVQRKESPNTQQHASDLPAF